MSDVLTRINDIVAILSETKDEKGIVLMVDCINSASTYVASVTKMEFEIKAKRFLLETDDFQDLVMSLDEKHRISHDALLSNCKAFNRYLRNTYPESDFPGGIFGLSKERLINFDRHVAADWAVQVVSEIFNQRQIRRNGITSDITTALNL